MIFNRVKKLCFCIFYFFLKFSFVYTFLLVSQTTVIINFLRNNDLQGFLFNTSGQPRLNSGDTQFLSLSGALLSL